MHEGFHPARRIVDVLAEIDQQQLVLPAIQREFVWPDAKVCSLFDSLMRGYPIGGVLFWRVSDETVRSHPFYGFIRVVSHRLRHLNETRAVRMDLPNRSALSDESDPARVRRPGGRLPVTRS